MIRGLFNFVTKLLLFIVFVLIFTSGWVIYDGLSDTFDTADCALVPGHSLRPDGGVGSVLRERLDRAIELYNNQKIPTIIVSAGGTSDRQAEADAMALYLRQHQVKPRAILEDTAGTDANNTLHGVAELMDTHHLTSVMLVTHYYDITLTKMELSRAGVKHVSQAHAGKVRKEDILGIVTEVFAIYQQLFEHYLGPAASKAAGQAKAEAQKLTSQMHSETHKVQNTVKKEAKP